MGGRSGTAIAAALEQGASATAVAVRLRHVGLLTCLRLALIRYCSATWYGEHLSLSEFSCVPVCLLGGPAVWWWVQVPCFLPSLLSCDECWALVTAVPRDVGCNNGSSLTRHADTITTAVVSLTGQHKIASRVVHTSRMLFSTVVNQDPNHVQFASQGSAPLAGWNGRCTHPCDCYL